MGFYLHGRTRDGTVGPEQLGSSKLGSHWHLHQEGTPCRDAGKTFSLLIILATPGMRVEGCWGERSLYFPPLCHAKDP